jgi:hypothetical protein
LVLLHGAGFKGWKNAASITGKDQKDLTWKDKAKAAGAGAMSALTLGLVSPKSMYKFNEAVGGFAKKAFSYTPLRNRIKSSV